MNKRNRFCRLYCIWVLMLFTLGVVPPAWGETPDEYQALPIIGATSEPPLVMLVLGRNHKLYYEAYNDASDLDEDGDLDVGYDPGIDYYGYFDSYKVYTYSGTNELFEPLRVTDDKKVDPDATNEWSGDYLNYLTMSRMDAIRKVLYGGYRSTDSATETVLERAYIPRDAHTWGKEYESIDRDGYDIRYYTPLDLPEENTYHLFASTSLYDAAATNYRPLLRVLPDNTNRIWDWVSIESTNGLAGSLLETSGSTTYASLHPASHSDFDDLVDEWAIDATFQGESDADEINGSGNPNAVDQDYYLTLFSGEIEVTTAGTYYFAVDGDDAEEVLIDDTVVAYYYGGHGQCSCTSHSGSIYLTAGSHTVEFRHEEATGSDYYYLYWKGPDSTDNDWEIVPESTYTSLTQANYSLKRSLGASQITDYVVRVQVGVESMPEDSCKLYSSEDTGDLVYKPIGLLQRYGENQQMYFGLMTGSYAKNTSGGVLRKNIGDISDEIDPDTGVFTSVNGIIGNIDRLRIVGLTYNGTSSAGSYTNCGWITTRAINEGECNMWGNPIGEMMYETLRYFAGKGAPTSAFSYTSSTYDDQLGLETPDWEDPYGDFPYCSKPFMLVISDINPTYDSDQLPGSYFGSFSGDLSGMDVESLADAIGTVEQTLGDYYIGAVGSDEDGACTAKDVDGLGDVRGLCPEEPTKKGSYYSASVAYWGHLNDISTIDEDQYVNTFAVGLASPLPRIEISVGDNLVTLVPFAKSVRGSSINATEGQFQPTNTIVDFYVDTIEDTYGKFRINFEDVEQGADHDMDAIILYEYQVLDSDGNAVTDSADGVSVKVTLTSEYAAGGITQHCGYIISGTTQDGTYLEVRDQPDSGETDVDYYLDTPPGVLPGTDDEWDDDASLPLSAERTFTPESGTSTAASLMENPLWYAGKWGGFEDQNGNDIPDLDSEWDADNDGIPDNYFYVTNPLRLEEQLNASFAMIAASTASGTSSSVVASTVEGDATLYQAFFRPTLNTESGDELSWVGYLRSFWMDSENNIREDTHNDGKLDTTEDRVIVFSYESGQTVVHVYEEEYPDTDSDEYSTLALDEVTPIWEAGSILAETDPGDRNIFTSASGSDLLTFNSSGDFESLKYYLGVSDEDIVNFPEANIDLLGDTLDERAETLISYISGNDFADLRPRIMDGNVWKLGDIVYSTPVAISGGVESYDTVYSDESYGNYVTAQRDRQTMIYVGANDGMLHAFTGGVFNDDELKFEKSSDNMVNGQGEIGDEMWAYIPRAVLPHLKWLADPDYGHTYYVDLEPKIFDAKIAGDDQDEWGTFLLLGLNMGGKDIEVDTDGDDTMETVEPSYTLLDITDPTNPELMWEKSYDGMGMSASVPTIIKVGGAYWSEDDEWLNGSAEGQWLAVFGSGPHGDEAYDGKSDQPGRLYVIDLRTGEAYDPNGAIGTDYLFTTSDNAVINTPENLDNGMTYEVNAVYFGESIDSGGDMIGKVWSFDTYDRSDPQFQDLDYTPLSWSVDQAPENWKLHLIMETLPSGDAIGPVTAHMNMSSDNDSNIWVYFGTGKYVSITDRSNSDSQYLFGLKDPLFNAARGYVSAAYDSAGDTEPVLDFTADAGLLASDNYRVYTDKSVEVYDSGSWEDLGDFNDLLYLVRWDPDDGDDGDDGDEDEDGDIDSQWLDGWFREMETSGTDPSERCLNEFSILGGAVYATGYTPSEEECSLEGTSSLYGLYYETGTAYYTPLVSTGDEDDPISVRIETGEGVTADPTFSLDGEELISQSSTGSIGQTEVDTAFKYRSRITNWFE